MNTVQSMKAYVEKSQGIVKSQVELAIVRELNYLRSYLGRKRSIHSSVDDEESILMKVKRFFENTL